MSVKTCYTCGHFHDKHTHEHCLLGSCKYMYFGKTQKSKNKLLLKNLKEINFRKLPEMPITKSQFVTVIWAMGPPRFHCVGVSDGVLGVTVVL